MEVVANKNCAGIIAGSLACERETGVLCTIPRPFPPSLHEKTLCDHQCFSAIAAAESKKAAAEKDAGPVCRPTISERFSAFAAAESKKAAAEIEVVANKNRRCFAGTCHCAGIIKGCVTCWHGGGGPCLMAISMSLHRYSPKPLCDGCTNCGVIKLCIACPESKEAAAEKDARLVCGPKMSEPAWYFGGRPEAAASANNLLDIRDNAVA
jgi:hypothetical protein